MSIHINCSEASELPCGFEFDLRNMKNFPLGLLAIAIVSSSMQTTGEAQHSGVSKLKTLAMGNCTFIDVPVQVADESDINHYANPHMDGLFGAHEMAKFGMIIDCTRQMMYVNPKGSSAATSQKLAQ